MNTFYYTTYSSPLGLIYLLSDGESLTGLYFEGQKYFPEKLGEKAESEVFRITEKYLDDYFAGKQDLNPPAVKIDDTEYRTRIYSLLQKIEYGSVVSYSFLAGEYEKKYNKHTCARAVGSAVKHNPISIIIPCHRVIGRSGSLTGYAGGLDRKEKLLELEQKNKLR